MRYRVRACQEGAVAVEEFSFDAADEQALRANLHADGYIVLGIRRQSATRAFQWRAKRSRFPLFCREVRTLIGAGMTIVEATDTLSERERLANRDDSLAVALNAGLQQGQSLSTALQNIPEAPPVLVAAVRAGERTGNLSETLGDYLRFDQLVEQLRQKIISASIYPALVTGLGIGIALFLILVIMPNFSRVYESLRRTPSGATASVVELSLWMSTHRPSVVIFITLVLVAVGAWAASGRARKQLTSVALRIAWIRQHVRDFQLALLYQALALLLKGGYPMTMALTVATQSALDSSIASALISTRIRVEQGGSVSQALSDAHLCDEVGRRLMAAAERNGDFHLAADVVSKLYSERFERFVERLTRIVEPVLLLLVALMVGTLVVTLYLPIFDMATGLR